MIKQFAVYTAASIIPNTLSDSSSESILRFFTLDMMGKYIDLGWKKAVEDGYFIGIVKVTELCD